MLKRPIDWNFLVIWNLRFIATCWLGAMLPLLMVFANKSAGLALSVSATASILACLVSGFWPVDRRKISEIMRHPASWTSLALLMWMFLSIAWAHDPKGSLQQFIELIIPLVFGVALALTFPTIAPAYRGWLSAVAIFVAAAIILIDLTTGLHLRKSFSERIVDYQYNRSLVMMIILVWPLLAYLTMRRQWLFCLAVIPLFAAISVSASGTAFFAALVGIAVMPLAWFFPRAIRALGLVGLLLFLGLAPTMGTLTSRLLDQRLHETLRESHSSERQAIWLGFEAAARKKLSIGHGFGSSKNLYADPITQDLSPELRAPLVDAHPHNSFLQIWVELGLTGALLFAALAVFLMRWIAISPVQLQPFILTWVAVVSAISTVSHGAWQPWWIAALGASVVGFMTIAKELQISIVETPFD